MSKKLKRPCPGRSRRLTQKAIVRSRPQATCFGRERSSTESGQKSGPTDGAAALIGSTPLMRDLRDRIEPVALTDFTVLIEGGIAGKK